MEFHTVEDLRSEGLRRLQRQARVCLATKREPRKFPTTEPLVLVKAGKERGTARPACVSPASGDGWAVAFKMESHNHPSAIEPFQNVARCFQPVCSAV